MAKSREARATPRTPYIVRQDELSEADLHAYVDGLLPPELRAEVESYLAQHPDAADRAHAYRLQNISFHRLFAAVPLDSAGPGLRSVERRFASALRRRRAVGIGANIVVAMALAAVLGTVAWLGYVFR